MMTPTEYMGPLMDLGQTRRGIFMEMKYMTPTRSTLIYEVLGSFVIVDLLPDGGAIVVGC